MVKDLKKQGCYDNQSQVIKLDFANMLKKYNVKLSAHELNEILMAFPGGGEHSIRGPMINISRMYE